LADLSGTLAAAAEATATGATEELGLSEEIAVIWLAFPIE
jgi:hypothetical protein